MIKFFRSVPLWLVLVLATVTFGSVARSEDARPTSTITLSTVLEGDTAVIKSGVTWRIFTDPTDRTPSLLVFESDAAEPVIQLPPGPYIIHRVFHSVTTVQALTTLKKQEDALLSRPPR